MCASTAKRRIGYAICVDNREFPASLVQWKIYQLLSGTLATREGTLSVADELGESSIFPAACFRRLETSRGLQRLLNRYYPGETGWWVSKNHREARDE